MAVLLSSDRPGLWRTARLKLGNGDVLDVLHAELAEEAVKILGPADIGLAQDAQNVELDSVALQQLDRLHDPSPRALAAPVEAAGVVDRLRAVQTDADQKVLRLSVSHQRSSSNVALVCSELQACCPDAP